MAPPMENMNHLINQLSQLQIEHADIQNQINLKYETSITSLNDDEKEKEREYNRYQDQIKTYQSEYKSITGLEILLHQTPPSNGTLSRSVSEYISDVENEVNRVKERLERPDKSPLDIKSISLYFAACWIISLVSLYYLFSYLQEISLFGLSFLFVEPLGYVNCSYILMSGFIAGSLYLRKHSKLVIISFTGTYFGFMLVILGQLFHVIANLFVSFIFILGLFPIAQVLDTYLTRKEIKDTSSDSVRIFSEAYWKVEEERKITEKTYSTMRQEVNIEVNRIREALQAEYLKSMNTIRDEINQYQQQLGYSGLPWNSPSWNNWAPAETLPSGFSLGCLHHDALPGSQFSAFFPLFPGKNLLFVSDTGNNPHVTTLMRSIAIRLFSTIPPGKCIFDFIDPLRHGINLGEFVFVANNKNLISRQVCADKDKIKEVLQEIQNHITRINTDILAGRYPSVEEYNQENPEYSEPYRFVIIYGADQDILRRYLERIVQLANNQCGVYFFIQAPNGTDLNQDHSRFSIVRCLSGGMVWDGIDDHAQVTLHPEPAPSQEISRRIITTVDQQQIGSADVLFESAYNNQKPAFWKKDVPVVNYCEISIGKRSNTEDQILVLGNKNNNILTNVLISGRPGSGKSNLLHDIILGFATKYSPEEINFWLLDYKDGVGFPRYRNLEHVRILGLIGDVPDIDYAIAVFKHLIEQKTKRNHTFRQNKADDYAGYRQLGHKLPRILVVIDEYQNLLRDNDRKGELIPLIYIIAREARSAGIHLIFSSQIIPPLDINPFFDIRIAFGQTEAVHSREIIGNSGATGLTTGHAIFRITPDSDEDRNSHFTVFRALESTPFDGRQSADTYIKSINAHIPRNIRYDGEKKVFSIRDPVELTQSHLNFIRDSHQCIALLGEPVEFREPVAAVLSRRYGSNISIICRDPSDACGILISSTYSLLHKNTGSTFYFLMPEIPDTITSVFNKDMEILRTMADKTGNKLVICTHFDDMNQIIQAIERVTDNNTNHSESIFLLIGNFQRFLGTGNTDDIISSLVNIVQNGPEKGVHTIIQTDSFAYWEQFSDKLDYDRNPFEYRVGARMRSEDSRKFMNTEVCSNIHPDIKHRAYYYSFQNHELLLFNIIPI